VRQSAAAERRTLDQTFIANMLADTERMTPYRTSMKLDHDAGRPMEVEAILGAPLRAARAAGHNPPHLQWLYHHLAYLDNARAQKPREGSHPQ
jgi:2-dehydropantoate 2-reductase